MTKFVILFMGIIVSSAIYSASTKWDSWFVASKKFQSCFPASNYKGSDIRPSKLLSSPNKCVVMNLDAVTNILVIECGYTTVYKNQAVKFIFADSKSGCFQVLSQM